MMKKLKQLLCIITILFFVLPSCKKGEDDPFLSIHTRKARLAGDWKLKSGTITTTNDGDSEVIVFNGTTATTSSGSAIFTEAWKIEKNGSFEFTIVNANNTQVSKGFWNFGRKIKGQDLKNKESVIFTVTSETNTSNGSVSMETYSGTSCPIYPYVILELRNKQMVIKVDASDILTRPGSNYSSSSSGTFTFEQ